MRGLTRVEEAIHQLTGKVVSLDVYNADRDRMNSRLRDLETGVREAKAAETAADNRADEQRSRNRWTIIAIVASPFVSAIVIFIVQGGFQV